MDHTRRENKFHVSEKNFKKITLEVKKLNNDGNNRKFHSDDDKWKESNNTKKVAD